MKIFHVYPAKAFTTDFPRLKPRFIDWRGIRCVVFDGANVYADTREGEQEPRITFQRKPNNTYFIEISSEVFFYAGCVVADDLFITKLDRMDQQVYEVNERILSIYNDPSGYAAERAIVRDNDRRERDDKRRAHEHFRLQTEINKINAAKLQFLNKECVSWDMFEKLCQMYNVIIPIQTKGMGRKRIREIAPEKVTISGNHVSHNVFKYARWLYEEMTRIDGVLFPVTPADDQRTDSETQNDVPEIIR